MPSHTNAIRRAIEQHGGLASSGDLRERWDLSKSRMYALMKMEGFPEPVTRIGQKSQALYSVLDADAFREAQKKRRTGSE